MIESLIGYTDTSIEETPIKEPSNLPVILGLLASLSIAPDNSTNHSKNTPWTFSKWNHF